MVATRSKDDAAQANGSGERAEAQTGEKHDIQQGDANAAPDAKRAKTDEKQPTLEETISRAEGRKGQPQEAPKEEDEGGDAGQKEAKQEPKQEDEAGDEKTNAAERDQQASKPDDGENSSAEKPHADPGVPSNVLEKGIIYFFFRPRVNVTQPEEVSDIARSYMVLRPMAPDARLGSGPIGDAGNSRLVALPKKVLPESGKDRFLVFIEKAHASFQTLKDEFLPGSESVTKTRGTRVEPAAVPAAEGVYVITTTGRESHLAYVTTLPAAGDEGMGDVQRDLGVKERGSFIVSTKNPEFPGPANARLSQSPEFSKEIMDDFRGLRWMPSQPEHFDFPNAQILLIGESKGIDKAVEPRKKDEKEGKEEPREVLEELKDEDVDRMRGLTDSDSGAIFRDLDARAEEYPKMMTTF